MHTDQRRLPEPDLRPLTREEEVLLRQVLAAIRQIKHGHVQIVVQDSRVVQIDKTEKFRLA